MHVTRTVQNYCAEDYTCVVYIICHDHDASQGADPIWCTPHRSVLVHYKEYNGHTVLQLCKIDTYPSVFPLLL